MTKYLEPSKMLSTQTNMASYQVNRQLQTLWNMRLNCWRLWRVVIKWILFTQTSPEPSTQSTLAYSTPNSGPLVFQKKLSAVFKVFLQSAPNVYKSYSIYQIHCVFFHGSLIYELDLSIYTECQYYFLFL